MTATLERGVSPLEDPDFARSAFWPLVSERGATAPAPTPVVTVHRRRPDGRLVAEVAFGPSDRVFAKLYPDVAAGALAYGVHKRLWSHRFGGERYRVPEPLAYLPDHGVLLLRAAAGEQLTEGSLEGVRRAARWLAALHASGVDLDASEDAAQGVLRLARRATTAAASRPELREVFCGLLEVLAERYGRTVGGTERAPTHGRFSAEHVYVSAEYVTAVDLDRNALADPARDVGELLHRLRWRTRGRVLGRTDTSGIGTPCVLASQRPAAPQRRGPFRQTLLGVWRSRRSTRSTREPFFVVSQTRALRSPR